MLVEINAAQNSNGLRHRNYLRYRQYCSRRLHRLRRSVRFLHGRGKFVAKRVTPDIVSGERHLLIPLFLAERAWSYAMQLKQELASSSSRSRHHVTRRLTKAALWASELHELAQATADTRSALETEAYCATMHAHLRLEKEELKEALQKFELASKLYTSLAKISDKEQRELCMQRVHAVQPNSRYCKYMLQKQGGSDSAGAGDSVLELQGDLDEVLKAKIDRVLEESRLNQAEALDHVQWKGESLPLRSEQLRMSILQSRELVSDEAGYGRVLEQFDTACSLVDAELAKLVRLIIYLDLLGACFYPLLVCE